MNWLTAIPLCLLLACAAGEPQVDLGADQKPLTPCEALLEHAIDLQVGDGAGLSPEARASLDGHRRTLRAHAGARVVSDCETRGEAWMACAVAADSPEALEACR